MCVAWFREGNIGNTCSDFDSSRPTLARGTTCRHTVVARAHAVFQPHVYAHTTAVPIGSVRLMICFGVIVVAYMMTTRLEAANRSRACGFASP
jgi:hypothetical protein